ncbi:MAG: SUMF1/EgtB/PvdO family nonheme iron enzyme, partial [Kiritimatiellae bacterium]|nr:SUMF1/EgtB/PvdO family nonheme iron enzyme [Kiritimatiellia bacterium]
PDSFVGVLRRKSGLASLDLPAEAQWEFACRAGTTAAYNNGSDDQSAMDSLGRHWNNGGSAYSQDCATDAGTAAVGSYQPNAWGLYDMHGNVFEWCLDRHSSSGSYRVLRGGGWYNSAVFCTSSNRDINYPSYEYDYYGFRLVRTLSADPEGERGAEAATGAARAGTVCAGSATATITMLKDIAATVTFNNGNGAVVYDGQGHGVEVEVTDPADGAAVLFALGDSSGPTETFGPTAPMFTNACDVTVWVEISAEGYFTATNSAVVKIEKAAYDMSGVKWDYDGAFTYDGAEKTVTLTGLPDGVTAEYAGNVATNAGGYTATAELLYDTRNYEEIAAPDPLAWAIDKAVLNGGEEPGGGAVPEGGLSKFDVTEEYDGAAHTVDAAAVLAAFQSVAPGVAVGYALSGDAAEWSAEPESFVNVCETSVWYRVTLDNYEDFVKEVKVSVTPRDIANVSVEPIERIPFKGTAVEPEPVVTDGDPSIVTADDYDVSYRDNDRPGTATLTLTGKNNYTGTKDVEFAIGTAELTAEIAWAYLKATGTYFAQLKVTCTNGLAAGVDDLRFLFADRIGEDGKTEAALWNTPARAANPDTEVRGGETYRRVALAPSLITAENAPVTYGVSDLAASPVPVAERVIEMYVHRRVVPETGNEGAAKVGDFVGYVCWESGGEQKAIPLVADRSRSASIASLSSRASLSSLPSPRLLNAVLAVGVPLAEDSSPYCRIGAFSVEGGTIRGRIEVGAAAVATGATLPGSLGANATVTVLGAKSPAGPFTELSAVAVAADGSFSLARPAGAAFFRLRLDIVDAVK